MRREEDQVAVPYAACRKRGGSHLSLSPQDRLGFYPMGRSPFSQESGCTSVSGELGELLISGFPRDSHMCPGLETAVLERVGSMWDRAGHALTSQDSGPTEGSTSGPRCLS